MSDISQRSLRADLISGLVFIALGLLVFIAAWTMPRLESRGVHLSTIPGLVPMALGLMLACCGLLLSLRAWRQGALKPLPVGQRLRDLFNDVEAVRLGAMLALTLCYALLLIGRLPFWLATFVYVFAAIVLFERYLTSQPRSLLRCLILAGIQAVVVAAVVTLSFQEIFLVRLP